MADVAERTQTQAPPENGRKVTMGIEPPPGQTARRGKLVKVILAAALLAGAVFGIRYWLHARAHESTDDAFIEGTIVRVSPRVMGHVKQVLVEDNQVVKQGQPLVRLDPADFEARVAQAEAAAQAARIALQMTEVAAPAGVQQAAAAVESAQAGLAAAQAKVQAGKVRLEQARAQVQAAAATVEQAKAEVAAGLAQHEQARIDLDRYSRIAQSGGSTQYEVDRARTAATVAEAKLNAARKAVLAAEAQLAVARAAEATAVEALRQEEAGLASAQAAVRQAQAKFTEANVAQQRIEQARAQVQQLEEAARLARLQQDYTEITAPVSGRVTKKSVEPGEYVQVGQTLLAIVPQDVWVVANFKETQLTDMRVGQPAEIRVDAYPDHVFTGKVHSVQAGTGARFSLLPPENATGNFVKVVQRVPVKIVLEDRPDETLHLGPGMSVIAEVKVK